jgi:TRAP-type uncharacterized transport system fused permease subunit
MATAQRPPADVSAGPPGDVAPRRSDRSPWNWLLLIPIVVPLLVPLYNSTSPTIGGWPRFYWLQLVFVALGVICTFIVYRATRRSAGERKAARDAIARDAGNGGTEQ